MVAPGGAWWSLKLRQGSWRRRVAPRSSWKRALRHGLKLKARPGYGIVTDPKKAAYNRLYRATTGWELPETYAEAEEGISR